MNPTAPTSTLPSGSAPEAEILIADLPRLDWAICAALAAKKRFPEASLIRMESNGRYAVAMNDPDGRISIAKQRNIEFFILGYIACIIEDAEMASAEAAK